MNGIILNACNWVSPAWNLESLVQNSQYAPLLGPDGVASTSSETRLTSRAMTLAAPREASPRMQKDRMQTIVSLEQIWLNYDLRSVDNFQDWRRSVLRERISILLYLITDHPTMSRARALRVEFCNFGQVHAVWDTRCLRRPLEQTNHRHRLHLSLLIATMYARWRRGVLRQAGEEDLCEPSNRLRELFHTMASCCSIARCVSVSGRKVLFCFEVTSLFDMV